MCFNCLNFRFVIQSRGAEFKDTSAIGIAIRVHSFCERIPTGSPCEKTTQKVKEEVIGLLANFTLPILNLKDDGVASNSCWTVLLEELCDHTGRLAHQFCPGLKLFSELLPLPLPVRGQGQLSSEEKKDIANSRKLWSAHILQAGKSLRNLLQQLLGICDPRVCFWLRQVCVQISDLSSLTSALISEEIAKSLRDKPSCSKRILIFLSWLTEAPSFKVTLLDIIEKEQKVEEPNEAHGIWKALKEGLDENGQEQVLSTLQNLCDLQVTLHPGNPHLNRELTDSIVNLVLTKLSSDSANVFVLSSCVRTLALITESKSGVLALVESLDSNPGLFGNFAKTIVAEEHASDALSLIQVFLDFLCPLSDAQELAFYKVVKNLEDLLPKVKEKLEELQKNEDNDLEFKQVLSDKLDKLIESSEKLGSHPPEVPENPDVEMEAPDSRPSLSDIFESRQVLSSESTIEADQRPVTPNFEDVSEIEHEKVDLLDFNEGCFGKDYDLVSSTKAVCHEKSLETLRSGAEKSRTENKKTTALERKLLHSKHLISNFRTSGNMRGSGGNGGAGRSFGRMGQRPDGFRSRPPNTSRPPSLHVDDFLVLQSRGQQPTGPTGYNKQSLKAAKELFAQREAQAHQGKNSFVGYREATKEPVYGGGGGGGGGGARRSRPMDKPPGGRGNRSRGWSPGGMHPGDQDRRKFFDRRGGGMMGRDRRSKGGGREERSRHQRMGPR